MDIPETIPIRKSDTYSFALPNISKTHSKIPAYNTSRVKGTRHHSVFLEKIKQLTKDVKYEQMETTKITQQQKQLKGLLREFNQETYNILNRYIDRPIQMSSSRKPRVTSTSMIEVQEKEIVNSNQIMEICKRQMELLQKKCENLKYVTVQDFQKKIESIKGEIETLRNSNKEIQKGNTLRGLAIKKGDSKNTHEISEIEQQKLILEKKKQRLGEDMKYVNEEQEKINKSSLQIDDQIKKLSEQYNKYEKEGKDSKEQKQLKKVLQQKRKQYTIKKQKYDKKSEQQNNAQENTNQKTLPIANGEVVDKLKVIEKPVETKELQQAKVKKETIPKTLNNSNKFQYQYLKLLKQLDEISRKMKEQDQSIKEVFAKIQSSKKQILQLEVKLLSKKEKVQDSKIASPTNDKNKEEKEQKQEKKWSFF